MYNKYYIKAIKYSASENEIDSHIKHHTNEYGLYDPEDKSGPILADMLEENDYHNDRDDLDHLREHNGPFEITKDYIHSNNPEYPGYNKPFYQVKPIHKVYRHIALLSDEDYHEFAHHLAIPTPHNIQNFLDDVLSSGIISHERPEYSSESAAHKNDIIHKSGNFEIHHNPAYPYIAISHIKHVSPKDYEKIEKETRRRLNS